MTAAAPLVAEPVVDSPDSECVMTAAAPLVAEPVVDSPDSECVVATADTSRAASVLKWLRAVVEVTFVLLGVLLGTAAAVRSGIRFHCLHAAGHLYAR